jgi:putative endonuclease
MDWWVYLALGCDGQLYCGISVDPDRRVNEHNTSKRGAKWARAHRPLRLVWSEFAGLKGVALKREREIKTMSAAAKRRLAGLGEKP